MGRFIVLLLLSTLPLFAQHQVFQRGGFLFFGGDTINAFFFDEEDVALRIIDEGSAEAPHYGSLQKAMLDNDCLAGINGSFFADDKEHSPLGLLKTEGKKVSNFASSSFTVAGILYDTGHDIKLERSSHVSTPSSKMKEALQAGPFLVTEGKAIKGLNDEKMAARSFIATNGKGQWCIAMASSMTLQELADKLCRLGTLGNFRVQTALNLDGGSSCSYWEAETGTYYPSYKKVRNYIGLVPRKKS